MNAPASLFRSLGKVFAAAVLASIGAGAAIAEPENPVVNTDRGPVRGVATDTVRKFLGIPYAAPPVGDLRWRAPQPAARFRTPLDASQFKPHCAQNASPFGLASTSEDCLYLNVYTPADSGNVGNGNGNGNSKGKPVMVWIHGGAFVVGESDDYDPTPLVQTGNVIVVTINYRLGLFGFLAHPALTAESSDQTSGNYGIMDQQAALDWVQRNIRRFGGDPDNVTVFGESAGGFSVISQLVSPAADGLFSRAIVESGAYAALNLQTLQQAETAGQAIATKLNCATADCLRGLSVAQLLPQTPAGGMTPNVDGSLIPQKPIAAFASGEFNQVPIIQGTNRNEWTLFVALNNELPNNHGPVTAAEYPADVAALVGAALAPAVVNEYPLANFPSPSAALAAVGTDAVFACPAFGVDLATAPRVPTFAYEFNDPNAPQNFLPPISIPYGASHASEIQYLFNVRQAKDLSPEQQQLAQAMRKYWTQFAANADPNGDDVPNWPRFTSAAGPVQSLEPSTPKPITDFAVVHHCGFWAQAASGAQ